MLAIVMAAACSDSSDRSGAGETVFRLGIAEPTAIDPYNVQESEGLLVTTQLFEGLVGIDDRTNLLTPAVATSWEKTPDCRQWTFRLAADSVFSDGSRVDAHAFIRGWTRTVDGRSASDVALHMAGIEGFDALHGTEAAPAPTTTTFTGLTAPDPSTLIVRLGEADCEFDKKTLKASFSPVPESAGAADNRAFNDQPIGNGPFKLAEPWQHDASITLVPNERYRGERPLIDKVEITIVDAQNAVEVEYQKFRAQEFDYARVPSALISEARESYAGGGGFVADPAAVTFYLSPTTDKPPYDNVDVRKAISSAIDREAIMEGVYQGLQPAARALVPPSFNAAHQPEVCGACAFDPVGAKQLAVRGGLDPATPIRLTYPAGSGDDALFEATAKQLETNLGVRVELVSLPFKEFLETMGGDGASGLFASAWGADYPTPDNFLYPLLSSRSLPPGSNFSRYRSAPFDQLLDQARAAPSESESTRLYQEAERVAVGDDQAVIPLRYSTEYRVFDAGKWTNLRLGFFDIPNLAAIRLR